MRIHKSYLLCLACLVVLLAAAQAVGLQLGLRPAKDWLERLESAKRIEGMKIDQAIPLLKLKPGDVVADIGAGTGLFSLPLAQAVGPTGKLLAVEIDQDLLNVISNKAKEQNAGNVQTVLGKFDDPNLPSQQVDVAFFHDVLHHIEHREAYLKALATYLKPNARIVVIDLLKGHQNEPEMQVTPDQVKGWMTAAGFHMLEEVKLYEDKFFVIFGRNP